ncbi:MAG: hypothetical protein PHD02_04710 [Bacilli bacterium]|nr:hypothetical protein [Bacilli bacterium]
MNELINVFSDNKVLILAIVIFIFGLILLGYLITSILVQKKDRKIVEKVEAENKPKIEETKVNELEHVLDKMQETIDKKADDDTVSDFENSQEENAVISYQELLQAAKKDFPQMTSYDNKEESTVEIIEEVNNVSETLEPEVLEVEEPKKFRSSVFISPIYGVKDDKTVVNEIRQEPKATEKEENEQFLDDLKTFRNNL